MKQPKCRTCGKEHALGSCPEFQSTAARKDVQTRNGGTPGPSQSVQSDKGRPPAGTQALPVDTNSEQFDRKKYQMMFMRDKRKADKLGLKVSEYRKMKENEK